MTGYTIFFVGLMYFMDAGDHTRTMLAPNGTNPPAGMAAHYASFYIQEDDLVPDGWDWWEKRSWSFEVNVEVGARAHFDKRTIRRFAIPDDANVAITVSGSDQPGALEEAQFEDNAPNISSEQTPLHPDKNTAHTIAQMPVKNGQLQFWKFNEGGAAQLNVKYKGMIVIKVDNHTIRVKASKNNIPREIVFVNSPDLVGESAHVMEWGPDHFKLYHELDPGSDASKLHVPTYKTEKQLKYTNYYLRAVTQTYHTTTPGPSCSPGCC